MPDREKAGGRWGTERPSNLLKVTQQSFSKLDPAPNLQMSSLMPCPLDHESFNEATSAGLQAGPQPGAGDLPGIPNKPLCRGPALNGQAQRLGISLPAKPGASAKWPVGLSMPSPLAKTPEEEVSVCSLRA